MQVKTFDVADLSDKATHTVVGLGMTSETLCHARIYKSRECREVPHKEERKKNKPR